MFDMDMESVMNQARAMEAQYKEELGRMAVTGESGGGAVTVVVDGNKEITKIEFQAEALNDGELLADMVLAAVNGAYAEVDRQLKDKLPSALKSLDMSAIADLFKK